MVSGMTAEGLFFFGAAWPLVRLGLALSSEKLYKFVYVYIHSWLSC